jgi:hypothetical protein
VVCYSSFDEDFFYFAATVHKPALSGKNAEPFSDPLVDDSIAVFLQKENAPGQDRRTANSVQMAVSVAGGVQLYRGSDARALAGFQDFLKDKEGRPLAFKFAVNLKGTLNGALANDNAYTVEIGIPWAELGGPPTVGQRMRFNVAALSAHPTSAPLLSMSTAVKKAAGLQNPALWGEIVFVDAPVKSVASAPDAKVSARIINAKPIIDGIIEEGVWHGLTAFAFGEGAGGATVALDPTPTTARVRPPVKLKEARPAVLPVARALEPAPARVPQALPKLVFTTYHYDFQNDPRKEAPLQAVRTAAGESLIASHPMQGSGPWMTYDRVDWHRKQLEEMRGAGIDVMLPVYRASAFDKRRHAQRGLVTLAGALNHLANRGADYPMVGLFLDTTSLTNEKGEKPDLSADAAKARLYAAVKDFFLAVPERFRAAIPLDAKNGGGVANVVVLSSARAFAAVDPAIVEYCRTRFRADFGADLLVLGGTDFKEKAKLDGYVDDTRGHGFQMDASGWIKPASVGVGFDETLIVETDPKVRPRESGEVYRKEWKQALERKADWVFVDGWNDFREAAEIAPSFQHGVEYLDLTRTFSRMFAGGGTVQMRAAYLAHTVPTALLAGASTVASVRVQNAGTSVWTPEGYAVATQWRGPDGALTGAPALTKLESPVLPGQAVWVRVPITAPAQTGPRSLSVDVAQIGKKGDVTALFSGLGSVRLDAPVRVAGPDDRALPAYRLAVVRHDLPSSVEAGGTYTVNVTLRNDGAKPWRRQDGRISARLWRYTSPINSTGEAEAMEPARLADAGSDLPADIPPGQEVTVRIPVTFSGADGTPVRSWSQADNWIYQLRWEYSASETGAEGAVSAPEPLALVDTDPGVVFTQDGSLNEMPGDRRIPVRLGLKNAGPQAWLKDRVRVGYHWYYLDGTEAVWQDETTPLPADVQPGGEVPEMLAWVTAPPHDGVYWLVWDLKLGDAWASTLPSIRPDETLVRMVKVVRGRTQLLDLDRSYNLDGAAVAGDPKSGDVDGAGRAFPAELLPPFALTDVAPSSLWLPTASVGLDSPRRISFKWGSKGDKQNNLIQCVGQTVPMGEPKTREKVRLVHILAASTKPETIARFTLLFEDGSQQLTSVPMSPWDAPPLYGEPVGFYARYTRTRTGAMPGKGAALYHYVIKVSDPRKLAAIQMPNASEVKIAAITLEK